MPLLIFANRMSIWLLLLFINSLVEVVVKVMGDVFPELKQHELKIKDIIAEEEASFGRTLVKVMLRTWAHLSA